MNPLDEDKTRLMNKGANLCYKVLGLKKMLSLYTSV